MAVCCIDDNATQRNATQSLIHIQYMSVGITLQQNRIWNRYNVARTTSAHYGRLSTHVQL